MGESNRSKNLKLASWDGGDIWYLQIYDSDTTISLDNSGFIKFNPDVEVGDTNVYNTTESRLWSKVLLLLQNDIKTTYAEMRQNGLSLDNIMECIIEEQIDKIPATYYNKDMQTKYLDFGNTYLYALHGSDKQHIKLWLEERLLYLDTLWDYDASVTDFVSLRSSKLGNIYMDIETFRTMYLKVKWRNDTTGASTQKLRVVKNGEPTRFTFTSKTNTDQEIRIYGGQYIKSLGDLTNLDPTTITLIKAPKVNNLICHSEKLINTDASVCVNLSRVDLSGCTNLGSGTATSTTLDVSGCTELKYLNIQNTALQGVQLNPGGSNIKEIWYPKTVQTVSLTNCPQLTTVGLMQGHSCKELTLINCPKVEAFGDRQWNSVKNIYGYDNGWFLSGVQNIYLDNSYINVESFSVRYAINLNSVTLKNMPKLKYIKFGVNSDQSYTTKYNTHKKYDYVTNIPALQTIKVTTVNTPNLKTLYITGKGKKSFDGNNSTDALHYTSFLNITNNDTNARVNYAANFRANILDLSNTQLENINIYTATQLNGLKIPITVSHLYINNRYDLDSYFKNDTSDIYNYVEELSGSNKLYIDGTTVAKSYVEGNSAPTFIANIWTDIEENKGFTPIITTPIWDFKGIGEIEVYNHGMYICRADNCYWSDCESLENNIKDYTLRNANIKGKKFIMAMRLFTSFENVSLDYTEFSGKSIGYCFSHINDDVELTIPPLNNVQYYEKCLCDINTTKIKWTDEIVTKYFNQITSIEDSMNINLLPQTSYEEDGIIINNPVTAAYMDCTINNKYVRFFSNSNLKYIKELNMPNTTSLEAFLCFYNLDNSVKKPVIEKIGKIYAPKCTTMDCFARENTTIKEIDEITISNDCKLTFVFSNCRNLTKLKMIGGCNSATNAFSSFDKNLSSRGDLDLSELNFNNCNTDSTFDGSKINQLTLNGSCNSCSNIFSWANIGTLDLSNFEMKGNCSNGFNTATIDIIIGFNSIPNGITNAMQMFYQSHIKNPPPFTVNSQCQTLNAMYSQYTDGIIPSPFIVPKGATDIYKIFTSAKIPSNFILDCSNVDYLLSSAYIFNSAKLSAGSNITWKLPKYIYDGTLGTESSSASNRFLNGATSLSNITITFDWTQYLGNKIGLEIFMSNINGGDDNSTGVTLNGIDWDKFGTSNIAYNTGTMISIKNFTVHAPASNININASTLRMNYDKMEKFVDEVIDYLDCANKMGQLTQTTALRQGASATEYSTISGYFTDYIPVKDNTSYVLKIDDLLNTVEKTGNIYIFWYIDIDIPVKGGYNQLGPTEWETKYATDGKTVQSYINKTQAKYFRIGFSSNDFVTDLNGLNELISKDNISFKCKTATQSPKSLTFSQYTNYGNNISLSSDERNALILRALVKGWNVAFV